MIGISRPFNFQLPASSKVPILMFAGGSGIAPFRGFWKARVHARCSGRNILFLGMKCRRTFLYEAEIRDLVKKGKLELHIAFSRDRKGLVYDRKAKDLVEKDMEPRYISSAILEARDDIFDIIAPTQSGGLGGYIYICGSASFYETVSRALLQVSTGHPAKKKETLMERAFAQGRVMLDVFMAPRALPSSQPTITVTDLARNTGHRGGRIWIGIHGNVYDVTDFLGIHPGGALIVNASAGLDASTIFDRVGHTTNGEVMSLLSNYLIGYLAPSPTFPSNELTNLCNMWRTYLNTCVECLTSVSLEITSIQDIKTWFNDDLLDMCTIRKLYQFQSRFMENILQKLYGELCILRQP